MQTIYLDLSKKEITPLLYAKQGDVGRKFKVILLDDGKEYLLPGGAAVSVWYSGSSGEGNYTDIGAESAIAVLGNEIVVEMIAQMLTNYGVGTVCIVLHTADGDQLGTWNIPYMVEPLPGMGSAAAQAYFTAFSKAVESLPYPDASLSAAGKAADAAAVGAALAGKAPAGYGLGGDFSYITDANLATVAGKYATTESTLNLPVNGMFGVLDVNSRRADKGITQIFYPETAGYQGHIVVRACNNGTWGEWEWVNPPMVVGKEYRTTERWNGKAVYATYVEYTSTSTLGSSSGIETVNINFGVLNTHLVRVNGFVGNKQPFPIISSNGGIASIYYVYDDGNISLRFNNLTLASGTVYRFYIYYTKD